ncbi:alpha-galactosidase A precursor [Neofusicoccum parvum]|uniref:Alpha-galactosidase A n=1 Tax=Neofusicoccum parvum TaxID=310453 RepID=A0ACB5S476_9PEZI|nr:alpha-galactosidase A precursor [Neofusicoccum parvum]
MPTFQLLQASVDPEDFSELRILVDQRHVKYLTIDPGLYAADDMRFEPSLVAILPPLPHGDWNSSHISRSPTDERTSFARVAKVQLPAITHTTCREFGAPVVVKVARFAFEIPQLDAETRAYRWVEGQNIGPVFLGHVVEEGRVIGFLRRNFTIPQEEAA